MLGDIIGEVVTSLVGDVIGEWLSPDALKPQPSAAEGEWNASLGSVAAFLASIAVLVVALGFFAWLRRAAEVWPWLILGGAVLAMISGVLAHRALEVTQRRRALATIALWLSRTTIVTGFVVAALSIIGVF